MTTETTKTGTYKNFNATLEDGKYLSVKSCYYDDDPGAGSKKVRGVMSHFLWIWGLAVEPGSEHHSGGSCSATVHFMTAADIRRKLNFLFSEMEWQISNAAMIWAENLEDASPHGADVVGSNIVIYYEQDGGTLRERSLTDDELVAFWSWAVGIEQFS